MVTQLPEIQVLYKDLATTYDNSVNETEYPAPFLISSWIINCFGRADSLTILDVGCGTGKSSSAFFSHFETMPQVTGLDCSPEMIEIARKLPFSKLIQMDLECREEWASKQPSIHLFDAAVCVGVLDFIQQPGKLFQRIWERTKDHGYFGFSLPKNGDVDGTMNSDLVLEALCKVGWTIKEKQDIFGYTDSKSNKPVEYLAILAEK